MTPRHLLVELGRDPLWLFARQILHYDFESGSLTWLYDWSWARSHTEAGRVKSCNGKSYRIVGFDGRKMGAHQLIWFWVTGQWVPLIDHKDGDGLNNAWSNLRPATRRINAQNRRRAHRGNQTGFLGVSRSGTGFRARLKLASGRVWEKAGFQTPEEAYRSYVAAKREHHPGCTI